MQKRDGTENQLSGSVLQFEFHILMDRERNLWHVERDVPVHLKEHGTLDQIAHDALVTIAGWTGLPIGPPVPVCPDETWFVSNETGDGFHGAVFGRDGSCEFLLVPEGCDRDLALAWYRSRPTGGTVFKPTDFLDHAA